MNGLELLSALITNNAISEANRVGFGSAIAVVLLVISLGPIIAFLTRTMREEAAMTTVATPELPTAASTPRKRRRIRWRRIAHARVPDRSWP